eukprot:TRINITY_DN75624_c0_g1_i1.p1 TRINITY_DN75624_c0_g1~~TRINITY_DN75624_c0_g1_i1.p1  ORF type:complete len:368 (+),score=17.33 TRINITY_DN75624_c0_g1_i1:154-1104(+)
MTLDQISPPAGDVTIFVPTDEAFTRMAPAALQGLFLNRKLLRQLVELHIVPGKLYKDQLWWRTSQTLATTPGERGTELEGKLVPLNLQFFIQAAQIRVAGPGFDLLEGGNVAELVVGNAALEEDGVSHVVDKVLQSPRFKVCEATASSGCDRLEDCRPVKHPGNCERECFRIQKEIKDREREKKKSQRNTSANPAFVAPPEPPPEKEEHEKTLEELQEDEAKSPIKEFRVNLPQLPALLVPQNTCPCLKICSPIAPEHYPYGNVISSELLSYLKRQEEYKPVTHTHTRESRRKTTTTTHQTHTASTTTASSAQCGA